MVFIITITIIALSTTCQFLVAGLFLNESALNSSSAGRIHTTFLGSPVVGERDFGPNDLQRAAYPDFANATSTQNPTSKTQRPGFNLRRLTPLKRNVHFARAMATSKTTTTANMPAEADGSLETSTTVHMSNGTFYITVVQFVAAGHSKSDDKKVRTDGECENCNGGKKLQGSNSRRTLGAPVVTNNTREIVRMITQPPSINGSTSVSMKAKLRKRKLKVKADTANIVGLCAFPPYNDRDACILRNYFSEPLSNCEKMWALLLFVCLVEILAIAIMVVNGLIVIIAIHDPKMRTQYYAIKGE